MSNDGLPMHYVCTHKQAKKLILRQKRFWLSNCSCRASNPDGCQRSRIDVCLAFVDNSHAGGEAKKPISQAKALALVKEAEGLGLVARPFRNQDRTAVEGICFCCDDCCSYFHNSDEVCDRGDMIEVTDWDKCKDCGECELACYFGARITVSETLTVKRELCYGCGLCALACPAHCIKLVPRNRRAVQKPTRAAREESRALKSAPAGGND